MTTTVSPSPMSDSARGAVVAATSRRGVWFVSRAVGSSRRGDRGDPTAVLAGHLWTGDHRCSSLSGDAADELAGTNL